jgi:carbohydrate diacid regulator
MLRSRVLREHVLEALLADIASYDAQLVEPDFVVFRAAEIGFDLRLPRVAVAIEVTVAGRSGQWPRSIATRDMALVRSELLRTVREVFADPQDIVASMAPGWFGVLHRLPETGRPASAASACRRVIDLIGAHHGLVAHAAAGEPASTVEGLHTSYQDACDALRLGARVAADSPVHVIGDLRAQQLLAAVGHHTRTRLVGLITGRLRAQRDWPVLRETIVAWCENGFNLVRASEALHIHRNTLVYRMEKIEQISGRTLRDHRTTLALYLACLADQLGDGS